MRRLFGARRADGGTVDDLIAPSARTAAEALSNRLPLDHGLTVGRQVIPGQVVLDHPNVSRRHAEFEVAGGTVVVRDLGGTNGTYVNGELVRGAQSLVAGDRINIGPFELTFDGFALRAGQSGNVELQVQGISYDVRINRAGAAAPQRILHCARLLIRPSEFVCIIGANGTGKSTLMNIMAGRALPSEGSVLFNGVDLHANFPALKRDIAFVPQQDVLHEQLTLREALDYTARLRLPPDTTAEQRRAAVDGAACSVDLFDRLDQRIGALSGGQKKCASLASEILSRPSVLFLDEVTSGLDESTDWDIMRLLRRLADEGMTIVVVTHTLANVAEFCDKIVCMGRGGQPTFIGTFPEVLDFFAVRRLGEVFNRMDELGAESWRARFEQTVGATANLPPAAIARPDRQRANPHRRHGPALASALVKLRRIVGQGAILLHRNTKLLVADRRMLVMSTLQSLLIGGLIGYAFGTFGAGQERINAQNALLLLLGLSAIWLGCNAASKEIVGELAIFRRERDSNLSTAAFVGAKFLVSGVFTVLQLAIVYALVGALAEDIPGIWLEQFMLLTIGAMAGTAIGLLISAVVNTRDQATMIVPLALVPQLILAGVLVPKLPNLAEMLAKVGVSGYWLTEAMKSVFIAADGPIRMIDPSTGSLMEMTAEPAGRGAAIVALHALAFLLIAYLVTLLRHGARRRGT
jgi:ABC transport system ATP-binding/permease protein